MHLTPGASVSLLGGGYANKLEDGYSIPEDCSGMPLGIVHSAGSGRQ